MVANSYDGRYGCVCVIKHYRLIDFKQQRATGRSGPPPGQQAKQLKHREEVSLRVSLNARRTPDPDHMTDHWFGLL